MICRRKKPVCRERNKGVKRETMAIALFIGVPLCMIVMFGLLARMVWERMKAGEISKTWGYVLETIFLIPSVFCAFIVVVLIGAFTGIIPLM